MKNFKLIVILLVAILVGQMLFAAKGQELKEDRPAFRNAMKNGGDINAMREALDNAGGNMDLGYCVQLVLCRFGGFDEALVLDALKMLVEYNEKTNRAEYALNNTSKFGQKLAQKYADKLGTGMNINEELAKAAQTSIPLFSLNAGGGALLYKHAQEGKLTQALLQIPMYGTKVMVDMFKYMYSASLGGTNAPISIAINEDIDPPHSDEILKYMIDNGGWQNWYNFIALVLKNRYDLAKLCLDKGFDINSGVPTISFPLYITDNNGKTALWNAKKDKINNLTSLIGMARIGNLDSVKFLVENGATVSNDALAIAQKYKNKDIVDYLKSKGAK